MSSLLPQKQSLHWSNRLLAGHLQSKVRLMHCKVLLYSIWKGFKAIMLRDYSDESILSNLIDLGMFKIRSPMEEENDLFSRCIKGEVLIIED